VPLVQVSRAAQVPRAAAKERRPERARRAPAASWPTGSETAGRPTRLASVAKRITALSSGRSDAPHFRSCGLRARAGAHPSPSLSPPPHRANPETRLLTASLTRCQTVPSRRPVPDTQRGPAWHWARAEGRRAAAGALDDGRGDGRGRRDQQVGLPEGAPAVQDRARAQRLGLRAAPCV